MATSVIANTGPDPEFEAMWGGQMLDFPTISRNEAGEWNYFDVQPESPEMIYDEDGELRSVDGLQDWQLQTEPGEDLAQQTLRLAGRYCEADCCALTLINARTHEIAGDIEHPAYTVAVSFIDELLSCAIKGVGR